MTRGAARRSDAAISGDNSAAVNAPSSRKTADASAPAGPPNDPWLTRCNKSNEPSSNACRKSRRSAGSRSTRAPKTSSDLRSAKPLVTRCNLAVCVEPEMTVPTVWRLGRHPRCAFARVNSHHVAGRDRLRLYGRRFGNSTRYGPARACGDTEHARDRKPRHGWPAPQPMGHRIRLTPETIFADDRPVDGIGAERLDQLPGNVGFIRKNQESLDPAVAKRPAQFLDRGRQDLLIQVESDRGHGPGCIVGRTLGSICQLSQARSCPPTQPATSVRRSSVPRSPSSTDRSARAGWFEESTNWSRPGCPANRCSKTLRTTSGEGAGSTPRLRLSRPMDVPVHSAAGVSRGPRRLQV